MEGKVKLDDSKLLVYFFIFRNFITYIFYFIIF